MLCRTQGRVCWLCGPEAAGKLSVNHLRLAVSPPEAQLTLYPDDLMWTPRLVRVDFIRMKKDRSRVLSVVSRLGLAVSTEEQKKKKKHRHAWDWSLYRAPHSFCSGATLEFTKNTWLMGAERVAINLPRLENVYFAENKKEKLRCRQKLLSSF